MTTTTDVVLVRRFDDLSPEPRLYRCRRSALGTAAASGYVLADVPVEQNPPYLTARPRGVGGRVAPRTGPIRIP